MAQNRDSFFLTKRSDKPRGVDKVIAGRVEKKFPDRGKEIKSADGDQEIKTKKPFDKKTYRLKKYSNKYKLEKWEDQRKKKLLRNYYKEVKNEAPSGNYKPIKFDDVSSTDEEDGHTKPDEAEHTKEEKNTQYANNNVKRDSDAEDESASGRFVRHPDLINLDKIDILPDESLKKETNQDKVLFKNSKAVKKDAFWKAKAEFSRLKQDKEQKKKEIENTKQLKEQKLAEYKKKKAERFKKLSKKTRKGQPVMTGRLELLLEKIMKTK